MATSNEGRASSMKKAVEKKSEPPKVGKGHRQRGAGTVIVSPPVVTTDDGIKLAPHMRLPSILLQEYCQREKLPKPIYEAAECSNGSYRMRVKIVDLKNRRKDLVFLPSDPCDSERMARDFAAMLALYHFQSSLPLERKFPEPYRTTWLDMISRQESSPRSSKPSTSVAAVKKVESSPQINSSDEAFKSPAPILGLKSQYEFSSVADKERREQKRRMEGDQNADKTYAEVTDISFQFLNSIAFTFSESSSVGRNDPIDETAARTFLCDSKTSSP
jgi:hypothetical protein